MALGESEYRPQHMVGEPEFSGNEVIEPVEVQKLYFDLWSRGDVIQEVGGVGLLLVGILTHNDLVCAGGAVTMFTIPSFRHSLRDAISTQRELYKDKIEQ